MSLDQSISEQEKMLDRKNLVQEAYKYLTEGFIMQPQVAMKSKSLGKEIFFVSWRTILQENRQRPSWL